MINENLQIPHQAHSDDNVSSTSATQPDYDDPLKIETL